MSSQATVETHAEPKTPADLARHLIDLLNAKDLDAAESYWADELEEDFIPLRVYRGKRAARGFFEGLFAAFPDFHLDVVSVVGDDESAFISWRATATFTGGPFEGITANGASVDLRGCDHMRFRNRKLVANTIYYDGSAFARAVGLLPPDGSTAERAMKSIFNSVTRFKSRWRG